MLPGPPTASPPESDQTTGAAFPSERVAVNCSTDLPLESMELQPAQLVSMEFILDERASAEVRPDEIDRTSFARVVLTDVELQPVTAARMIKTAHASISLLLARRSPPSAIVQYQFSRTGPCVLNLGSRFSHTADGPSPGGLIARESVGIRYSGMIGLASACKAY
jgi:hypothetical protein